MPVKVKKPASKPRAPKKAPKSKPKPQVLPSLFEQQDQAVAAVEHTLDVLGEKIGEAAILELRNEFDKVKFHEPWRKLFALARFGQAA